MAGEVPAVVSSILKKRRPQKEEKQKEEGEAAARVLLVANCCCCRRGGGFVPVARAFSLAGRSSSPAELGRVGEQLVEELRCASVMGLSTEQAFA